MKKFYFLFLIALALSSSANNTFNKLCEVNKYWLEQKDVLKNSFAENLNLSEKEWIRFHLMNVEQTLRNRNVNQLSASQKQNREKCLGYLHQYWNEGNFPINEDYTYRTPIFIDKHDNFCALGYLIKASGHENVSRMIAAKTNLAYVHEMSYPELFAWANEKGFSVDELAWIQPGYPPKCFAAPVGRGTDGDVNELFADSANEILYVGGSFTNVDSTIVANNIAYVTESNGVYTWHNMGTGVNGTVHAITKFNNNIFAAGEFSIAGGQSANNVAYWDGNSWHGAGCTYGVIKDLIVFRGELYAAGHFDICAALSEVNFAKWNGTNWQQLTGLAGLVNTMEVWDTTLVLGGRFIYNNDTVSVIKWNSNLGFDTFSTSPKNEVNDFEFFRDTLYAVCTFTDPGDTYLFRKLKNNSWDTTFQTYFFSYGTQSFNTLCNHNDTLMVGGNFFYEPSGGGNYIYHNVDFSPNSIHYADWFLVDSTINKMVVFKNELFSGGKFKNSNPFGPYGVILNGITRKIYHHYTGISEAENPFNSSVYPNPATQNSTLQISAEKDFASASIFDISGRKILETSCNSNHATISIGDLAKGIYLLQLTGKENSKAVRKIIIQ